MRIRSVLLAAASALCVWSAVAPIASKAAGKPATTKVATPWWTHAVIYEIYTRSFQDSNGDGIGDLKGVSQRLDYLQKLGVDALWLTPFFPSPNADFGYDISDYTSVASEYGTMADWDALVKAARQRGIKILVDFVVNHTSDQHPWFKESRSSRNNPKRDWYVWRDGKANGDAPTQWPSIFKGNTWAFDALTSQWYYHIFLPQQPDVNWASPDLRKAMFDVARFWLKHGASGFRLDATPYLFEDAAFPEDPSPQTGSPSWLKPYNSERLEGHEVMRQLHSVLGEFAGDPVLLGESATASIQGLANVYGTNRDEINLPMDFMFANNARLDATAFKADVDNAELKLSGQTPVFFLSSHDRARQWNNFGDGVNNDQIAKLTAALTLLQRGTAIMYYGEELGMGDMPQAMLNAFPLGPNRPVADERDKERTPMQWSATGGAGFTRGTPWLPVSPQAATYNVAAEQRDAASVSRWYAQLLKLRHDDPVFRDGAYVSLESGNKNVFAFARQTSNGRGALVVLNMSGDTQPVHIAGLPAGAMGLRKLMMASPAAVSTEKSDFSVAPYGVVIAGFAGSP
jgi:alpha-glucosidase